MNWFSRSSRPGVRGGDRFRVTRAIEVSCLTHWNAPFTGGGNRGVLRPNEIIRVLSDPGTFAWAAACVPDSEERARQLEAEFVPEEDRRDPKYAGFSFVIGLADLARSFEPVV